MVPYRCTIDVRTPWARHGVPTGPPEARRDPTDPRRTAGGTVGPGLIGASPVWAARNSYWRQPVLLHCTCFRDRQLLMQDSDLSKCLSRKVVRTILAVFGHTF